MQTLENDFTSVAFRHGPAVLPEVDSPTATPEQYNAAIVLLNMKIGA